MNKLNGIIKDGKIFEAIEKENGNPCIDCELIDDCHIIIDYCSSVGFQNYFRFSQELTDKLSK